MTFKVPSHPSQAFSSLLSDLEKRREVQSPPQSQPRQSPVSRAGICVWVWFGMSRAQECPQSPVPRRRGEQGMFAIESGPCCAALPGWIRLWHIPGTVGTRAELFLSAQRCRVPVKPFYLLFKIHRGLTGNPRSWSVTAARAELGKTMPWKPRAFLCLLLLPQLISAPFSSTISAPFPSLIKLWMGRAVGAPWIQPLLWAPGTLSIYWEISNIDI